VPGFRLVAFCDALAADLDLQLITLEAVHQLKLILMGKASANGYEDQKKPDQSENSLLKMIENQILFRLF